MGSFLVNVEGRSTQAMSKDKDEGRRKAKLKPESPPLGYPHRKHWFVLIYCSSFAPSVSFVSRHSTFVISSAFVPAAKPFPLQCFL